MSILFVISSFLVLKSYLTPLIADQTVSIDVAVGSPIVTLIASSAEADTQVISCLFAFTGAVPLSLFAGSPINCLKL